MPDKIPTIFRKDDLKLISENNSASLKNRFIDKEVNKIKYQVLQQNNLGHKFYTHGYNYNFDEILINDYFADILNKLIIIFPDSEIKYTTDVTSSSDTKIYHNSLMTSNSSRPTYNNNEKKNANNTITIDWS
jgi:hypothetical protein